MTPSTSPDQDVANTPSAFARALAHLIDNSNLFTRSEWAEALSVTEGAISHWLHDRTIPRPEILRSILGVLKESDGVSERILQQFWRVASMPATEISPHGDRLGKTVHHYLVAPIRAGFLHRLDALSPERQESLLFAAAALLENDGVTVSQAAIAPSAPRRQRDLLVHHGWRQTRPRRSTPDRMPARDTLQGAKSIDGADGVFVGRLGQLESIRSNLLAHDGTNMAVIVVTGDAGIGKSRLALEYARLYEGSYDRIICVPASRPKSIVDSYRTLARDLMLSRSAVENVVRSVISWIQTTPRLLVVVDDLDDIDATVQLLPRLGPSHMIVTSRDPATTLRFAGSHLPLAGLPFQDSREYLLRATGRSSVEDPVEVLSLDVIVSSFGGVPRACRSVAESIVAKACTFEDYCNSIDCPSNEPPFCAPSVFGEAPRTGNAGSGK